MKLVQATSFAVQAMNSCKEYQCQSCCHLAPGTRNWWVNLIHEALESLGRTELQMIIKTYLRTWKPMHIIQCTILWWYLEHREAKSYTHNYNGHDCFCRSIDFKLWSLGDVICEHLKRRLHPDLSSRLFRSNRSLSMAQSSLVTCNSHSSVSSSRLIHCYNC